VGWFYFVGSKKRRDGGGFGSNAKRKQTATKELRSKKIQGNFSPADNAHGSERTTLNPIRLAPPLREFHGEVAKLLAWPRRKRLRNGAWLVVKKRARSGVL
jgi:hypothetical protein